MKIAFDHQAFTMQKYGGVSRYFASLAKHLLLLEQEAAVFAPFHQNSYLDELSTAVVKGRKLPILPWRSIQFFLTVNHYLANHSITRWIPDVVHETYYSSKPDDYQDVVVEFKRLLKDGGRLFISVPFGRYENHGWLQQFDHKMVAAIMDMFAGSSCDVTYYKYADGWQLSDAEACKECSYFDFHNRDDYESDYVAAARAVACIELVK